MTEHQKANTAIIQELLALLPAQSVPTLLALVSEDDISPEQTEAAVKEILEGIDWDTQREQLGELISQLMPLETLVPDIYRDWRPIVRDAVAFIGSYLSPARLAPKLIEQIMLPSELPLEQRLIILIAQVPSLQKIGQIVARNQNLDPAFRRELTRLENAIQDTTPADIQTEIEGQLGQQFEDYSIELDDEIQAEASVSAAMGFSWHNPTTGKRERGVFKVLKPHINDYFSEELELLHGLAHFFETNRHKYMALSKVNLGDLFDDVRLLLKQEVDFPNEQANLKAAYRRYANIRGVRIPRLIAELSTPTITTMSQENGVKATEAFAKSRVRRVEVASRIIEALIMIPLFAEEEPATFHADPHAGNLFYDEKRRELILLDWALTEQLNRQERRSIVLLMLAVALRDKRYIFKAIAKLSTDNLSKDQTKAKIVRRHVAQFISHLSPLTVPGITHVLSLLDSIILSGITVSASLLMFRKVLFTLDGVLQDIAPETPMEPILAWQVAKGRTKSVCPQNLLSKSPASFYSPLSHFDRLALTWSVQTFGVRAGLQTGRKIKNMGLRKFRSTLFGTRSASPKPLK